jgi:uncharacterized protein YigA (DUF484 family)
VPAADIITPLPSSVIGGLAVALVNHLMTRRRERDKKLAEARIEQLIRSWKQIERASNTEKVTDRAELDRRYDELEQAIASIVLLGAKREVGAARKLAVALTEGADRSANELLQLLRDSLRAELELEPVEGLGHLYIRMHRDKK